MASVERQPEQPRQISKAPEVVLLQGRHAVTLHGPALWVTAVVVLPGIAVTAVVVLLLVVAFALVAIPAALCATLALYLARRHYKVRT